jgi:hypothetical protein
MVVVTRLPQSSVRSAPAFRSKIFAERRKRIKAHEFIRPSFAMHSNREDSIGIAGFVTAAITIAEGALNPSDGECRNSALLILQFRSLITAAPGDRIGASPTSLARSRR